MSTSFGHIFSGGYAAGYYGYKWAEVLDADAFAAFQEEGIFSRETAGRFRREVLSEGDKRDAEQLYEAFRGKAPTIDALLRRDVGLALVYCVSLRVMIVDVDHEGYAVLIVAASLLVVLDDEEVRVLPSIDFPQGAPCSW